MKHNLQATRQGQRNHLSAPLKTYKVSPRLTDTSINNWLAPHHIVLPPPNEQRGELLVFLSGSFGQPKNQTFLLQAAAGAGYHAVNLSYPNDWTVGGICRRSSKVDCHEQVRLSILDGGDRATAINIGPQNSIYNRLSKLIAYLAQQQQNENWDLYIAENATEKDIFHKGSHPEILNWSRIAVAGHSQGGGHAALIAKNHLVARCIMLGAPADFSQPLQAVAPWLSPPHLTPSERYYGFVHTQDKGFQRILIAWKLLGLDQFGSPVNIDRANGDYQHRHQLITSAQPARQGKHHSCVAVDITAPRNPNGTLVFAPVWEYLFS